MLLIGVFVACCLWLLFDGVCWCLLVVVFGIGCLFDVCGRVLCVAVLVVSCSSFVVCCVLCVCCSLNVVAKRWLSVGCDVLFVVVVVRWSLLVFVLLVVCCLLSSAVSCVCCLLCLVAVRLFVVCCLRCVVACC